MYEKIKDSEPFFVLYSRGDVLAEEIDDFIDDWHLKMEGKKFPHIVPLYEFLGMSKDEYDIWIQDAESLPNILNARREGKSIDAAANDRVGELMLAARASDKTSIIALKEWLRKRNAKNI